MTLGRVAGVFGVNGWVKVYSYTRPKEAIFGYGPLWIGRGGEEGFHSRWEGSRVQGKSLVAALADPDGNRIEGRDAAAALIGSDIQIDRHEMPAVDEGEYYWHDLVGLQVRNRQGVELGRVRDLTSNGPQDILMVRQDGDDKTERLIPFVLGPIIDTVDLEGGEIIADWQPDY